MVEWATRGGGYGGYEREKTPGLGSGAQVEQVFFARLPGTGMDDSFEMENFDPSTSDGYFPPTSDGARDDAQDGGYHPVPTQAGSSHVGEGRDSNASSGTAVNGPGTSDGARDDDHDSGQQPASAQPGSSNGSKDRGSNSHASSDTAVDAAQSSLALPLPGAAPVAGPPSVSGPPPSVAAQPPAAGPPAAPPRRSRLVVNTAPAFSLGSAGPPAAGAAVAALHPAPAPAAPSRPSWLRRKCWRVRRSFRASPGQFISIVLLCAALIGVILFYIIYFYTR